MKPRATPTFIYGPAETPLEPGRRYAFRIRAKSIAGFDELDLFKNNGYSEVFSFVYGDACDLPTGISTESVSSARVSLKWEPLFNHTAFKVRYRQEGTTNWYYNNATLPSANITSLKPNTTYEYQVAATCGVFDGPYSSVSRVTTSDVPQVAYSCGVPITPFNLDPAELIGSLQPGDVIQAGDFDVKLVTVNGSNGVFTGEGVIEVPYLNKAKVKTSFANITVNKELRMVNGFMNVTGAGIDIIPQGLKDAMEELSETLDVLDSALTEWEENQPVQTDWESFVPDTTITVIAEIVDVSKNENGSVTVTDSKGNTQTLPSGTNYAVKDDKGNGYLVDKNGNIHKTTSDVVNKLAKREYNLVLKFSKDPQSQYGFDHNKFNPPADTEVLKDNYRVGWKSVASGVADPVIANLGVSGIDKSKIRFELGGIPIQAPIMNTGTTTSVSITGESDGSFADLLALYTPADTSKEQVLGKLKVASYDKISKSLVIVPVNNVTLPVGLTANIIEDSLNAIYGQAVVDWKVRIDPQVEASVGDPFDDGESGLLSNYTGDMKKAIKAFGRFEDETYYLFLVRNPKSGNALGYMPRGKQAGFIFVDEHGNKEELVRTMAHELGHGAFHLHHTFKEPNFTLAEGTTDNLMDYPSGNKLYKYQWDKIRYPDIVVGVFEEDVEAEAIGFTLAQLPQNFKNDDGTISFFAGSGSVITLPATTLHVAMATGDPLYYTTSGEMYEFPAPVGSLMRFTVSEDGTALSPLKEYRLKVENGITRYYCESKQEYYTDIYSASPNGIKNALVGMPYFQTELGYNIYKVPANSKKIPASDTDKFGEWLKDLFTVADYIYGSDIDNTSQQLANTANENSQNSYAKFYETNAANAESFKLKSFTDDMSLSLAGLLYLAKHGKYSSSSSPLAPIIITNAYWVSLLQEGEASNLCELSHFTLLDEYFKESDKILAETKFEDISTETAAQIFESGKLVRAEAYYKNLRGAIRNMVGKVNQAEGLNAAIQNISETATDAPTKVLELLTPFSNERDYACNLESLTNDNRMKAINLLNKIDKEIAETLIIKLISTATYNAQAKQLVTKVFANNGELYERLYKQLTWSDFHRYMNKLYEIITALQKSGDPDFKVVADYSLPTEDPQYSTIHYSAIPIPGGKISFSKFHRVKKEGISYGGRPYYMEIGVNIGTPKVFGVTEIINVTFLKENSFLDLYQDKYNNDEQIPMPAFYLAYLIDQKIRNEQFKCIRVMVDVLAIVLAVPSGGQSLTIAGGITIALAGIDIAIAITEEDLQKNQYGQMLLSTWSVVQWAEGGVGAALILKGGITLGSRAIVKVIENGKTLLKLDADELLREIQAGAYSLEGSKAIRNTVWLLSAMGLDHFASLLRTAVLVRMEAAIVESTFQAARQGIGIRWNNWVECSAAIDGQVAKIFDLQISSAGSYIKGQFRTAANAGDELIGQFKGLGYYDEAANVVKTNDFSVYSNQATKQPYLVKGVKTTNDALASTVVNSFFTDLKKICSEAQAKKIFDYYESKYGMLRVLERGTESMVDGRGELLKLITKFSSRSDLINDLDIIDAFAFLGNFPNLRLAEESLLNVKKILNNKFYSNIDDVQKAVNSSNNTQELLEALASAKNADEFSAALRDIKVVDFPTSEPKPSSLTPSAVNPQFKTYYDNVVKELGEAVAKRQQSGLTQLEKTAVSEQIGVLSAQKSMLESGLTPLEHRISLTDKRGQFDGVFWNGNQSDPLVAFVEAKGGNGALTSRKIIYGNDAGKRAQQGSLQYRNDIVANMREAVKNLPQGNLKTELKKTIDIIDDATLSNKVKYILVRQDVQADGKLGELIVMEF